MTNKPFDQIDRMLSAIASEGSCIELRMQSSFPGSEAGHRRMVEKLRTEASTRLHGRKLNQVLQALNRLNKT